MLLDPFYGTYGFWKWLARFLNRALLLFELGIAVTYGMHLYHIGDERVWYWVLLIILFLYGVHLANLLIRGIWNIVVAIFWGTTDADEIWRRHCMRVERRENRRVRRRQRRESRREARQWRKLGGRNKLVFLH